MAAGGLSDQSLGLLLATSSGLFIGSSFIIKKKGLRRAGASGLRAGATLDEACRHAAQATANHDIDSTPSQRPCLLLSCR